MGEIFHQNENLQMEKHIGAQNSHIKTYKGNSCGVKYGLSELSNDKTYLETELPARKRIKPETRLLNNKKCLKICKLIENEDKSTNFVNEEKYSSEIPNILSGEQEFENNLPIKELLKSDLNAEINQQIESFSLKFSMGNSVLQNNMLDNQFKLYSNELNECNFEKKLENHKFQTNSEYDSCNNLDNDKISNRGIESETDFDDEVKKCCKLLNLDVPKMAVSTTNAEAANDNFGRNILEKSQTHNCKIDNPNCKNQNSDLFYTQSNKLEANLRNKSNNEEIKLQTINLDKKNCININNKFDHDNNIAVENNNLLKLDSNCNDKYNTNLKIKNTLKVDSISVRKPKIFEESEMVLNHDGKSKTNLNLKTENTLSSDILKFQEVNQNISQSNLNNGNQIGAISTAEDSKDILILSNESDIDFVATEHTMLEDTSSENKTVFHTKLENDSKTNTYIGKEIKKKDNLIFNEKIELVDENHSLDNNYESPILDGISSNNFIENKNDFDIKMDESFVSEYEISLLEDTDSIVSEESLDSEFENSLLEDDINDEKSQNDIQENNSTIGIQCSKLPNGEEEDQEDAAIPRKHTKEFKREENDQITNKIILHEKEIEVVFDNKICSKPIAERNVDSCSKEKIPSNYQIAHEIDKTKQNSTETPQRHTKEFKMKENDQTTNKINLHEKEIEVFDSKICSELIAERNVDSCSKEKILSNYEIAHETDKAEQNLAAIPNSTIVFKSKKAKTLKFEKPDVFHDSIKKELSQNVNDSHLKLNLETNNESQIENILILNNNKCKNAEKTAAIVTANEYLAGSSCTKLKLNVPNITDSNINEEFQPSNKVIIKCKNNEIRTSKEKESTDNMKKQVTESISTNKVIEKITVKTDFEVSTSGESKQDVKNIISDYYEEEKEDIINPGWNKIKALSTDEERYRQVKNCWKSKTIPNPFKNLTYYSYRKNKVSHEENDTRATRQHKRHASNNLNDKNAKRSRSCTYIFDDRIKFIQKEKETETKKLKNKMFKEVTRLNELQYQEEIGVDNFYEHNYDPRRQFQLNSLRRDYDQKVSSVTAEYEHIVNDCCNQYTSEINSLKNSRNEVLQFYSFYKGLNTDEYKDPTILTNAQIQELEEIENIYKKMDLHYR